MYDKSGGGQEMRKYMSINLAWWHNFKQVTKTIWRSFANTIWAPLWHRLYPSSKFSPNPHSPQEPALHFLFMARAYPSFKDELNEALDDNQVGPVGKAMLQNIKFLCEFAIPTVRSHCKNTSAHVNISYLMHAFIEKVATADTIYRKI
jgi:hypothetical protein